MMDTPLYLTAKEAAAELGVSLATLYAYVSRGLIRSEARAGSRSRLYRAEDVRSLIRRRDPENGHGHAPVLTFGTPLLDSAITLITGDRLYYRGRDATRLAADASLEATAGLIWDARDPDPFATMAPSVPPGLASAERAATGLRPVERCVALLPFAAAADPTAFNLTPGGVAATGARLLRWVAALTIGRQPSSIPVHLLLAEAWDVGDRGADLIRAALVLCADHELNASTFTVRCVAATGATPYGAVLAGMTALQGPKHGGMTEQVAALLPSLIETPDPRAAIADRLRRGEGLPGFGHQLYPGGDPRARALLSLLNRAYPGDQDLQAAAAAADAATAYAGQPPTIDFALALLALKLRLPDGAPLGLFAVGRTVGWIGHAAEQYASGQFIRPRARYTGMHP